MGTVSSAAVVPPRHWPFFLIGVLLFAAGPVAYFVQFRLHYLKMPWYAPALATAGVLLMAVSVWEHRGVWRGVGLALFVVVCGLEWFLSLVAIKTPDYTGPAQAGHKVPAFATTRADGEPFTDRDLEDGRPTVLLFFRGRW